MPPPPPDRRDYLYREGRRHDGGVGDSLLPPAPTPPRWRDSPYHPPPPPPLRDPARPSPRRAPPLASSGYYRQGGGAYDRSYPDDPPSVYTPSRSDRYWPEDDDGGYKGFGRYGSGGRRDGRDMRGSYRKSPYRGGYGSDFSRNHSEQPPPPPPRRSPLSTRLSASGKEASAQPLAAAGPHGTEDEAPRKKARLGWGQGLAKYEKQKVQGPSDPAEVVADVSSGDGEQKTSLAPAPSVASVFPAAPLPESAPAPPAALALSSAPMRCSSPVTAPPYCSSAPEDKSCEMTPNTVTNSTKDVLEADGKTFNNEFSIKLDQLGDDPINGLTNILVELMQHNDSCSGDSNGPTSTCKLLQLKESISKEIEKTELQIDSLEGELKSVNTEAVTTLESSPTGVTHTENLSPSGGTSKVPGSAEICDTFDMIKEPGELIVSPKVPVVQDADVKGVDMMEVETAPVRNAKTVPSEESAVTPGVAEGKACAAADLSSLIASEEAGSQNDIDNDRPKTSLCHADSMKIKVSDELPVKQWTYCDHMSDLHSSFTSANNDIAKEMNEVLFKSLPAGTSALDLLASSDLLSQRKIDLIVKERLGVRKTRLRLKEQILTMKFKAYRHLWKEDVRLLSAKKQRLKSNKRIDQNNRTSQIGSQRQRFSNRSRLAMPAGNLSTFSTPEMSDVARKLFSESQIKRCRNYLKMPALIIDEKEKEHLRFLTKNGLVVDPVLVEKERIMINPWTQDEKEIFMEMLAKFGKDFSKISSFITHKTTADCVEFYYKHHKSDSFREVKKLLDLHQQLPASNYLGAKSGQKWNPESNAASLDMLGVASAEAAHDLEYANKVEKISVKSLIRTAYGSNVSFVTKKSSDKECIDNVPLHERESVAADVLAGICGTPSPDGMGSCITSSADPGLKISMKRVEHVLSQENDKNVNEEESLSDQECEFDPVDWNDDEKSIFIEAMNNYGKDFSRISSCVKSKSYEQCKVFFSKARKSLGLDLIHQGAADVSMPASDTNGGRSDTDEACAVEMDSAICRKQSCSKIVQDVCPTEGAILGPDSVLISKQTEGDISNRCIVDVKIEEDDKEADKNCSNVDDKRSSDSTHQAGPININCPESTDKLQGTDDAVDQVNMHSSVLNSSNEHAMAMHSEVRSSLHSVDVLQTDKAEGTGTDPSQVEECSHHAVYTPMTAGNSGSSAFLTSDSGIKDNVHISNMSGASTVSPAFTSNYQHSLPGDMPLSKPKPLVTSLTPKDLMPVQFSSVLPDPTAFRFEGIKPNFEDSSGNKVSSALGAKDICKYPAFKDPSDNEHDTLFRNIDGYMNNHLTTELPVFSQRTASGTVSTSQTKFQNGRSSSVCLPNSSEGIQWPRKPEEVPEDSLRPCARNAKTEGGEKQKRPGDVKLFGQILSHQPTLPSSGSLCNGSQSKPPSPKIDKTSVRLTNNPRDLVVFSSRPGVSPHVGLEERSVRSYGHLDGSTIQPEPLLVMAKCQRSLASVPFYSAKNSTVGVFPDYQQPSMQPHQLDPKPLEMFSDSQKRNGLELVSGFGGAGILVSNVSDHVAALKARYGPGSKIMGSDADPWKDIGSSTIPFGSLTCQQRPSATVGSLEVITRCFVSRV
uniref:SANT domain-containing protein n=1 Tax=Zea mays TaxID=4577 RepID=A0A804PS96_MAIZE